MGWCRRVRTTQRVSVFDLRSSRIVEAETLYSLVSTAIWRAEQAEDGMPDSAAALWAEVSSLEEQLAKVIPALEAEGRIARRGAVRAALKASDLVRARTLVDRFANENGCPRELVAELRAMMSTDEQIRQLLDEVPTEEWTVLDEVPTEEWTAANVYHEASLSRLLGAHIVREKEAHDLSRNPELASFQFLGYRTTAAAVELVALCDADGLLEGDIVRLRDEFFDLVRRLPHDYGLKPRGRNPNGLLGFVFADGCPEPMARFIARQTRISHAAGTGGVSVAWAIDVRNRRIHTHDNPVSIFPPVIIAARTVYPGLEFLQSIVEKMPDQVTDSLSASPPPARNAGGHGVEPDAYDLFIAYASEDAQVAREIMHELTARGLRVWLDRTALRIGDSLSQSIDRGLAGSRFGLVLLSRNFFQKPWTQRELGGMFARETMEGRTLVLPLWHEIDEREIARHSPILADKYALKTSDGISFIADTLMDMFDPASLPGSDSTSPPTVRPQPALTPRTGRTGAGSGKIHILFLAANSVNRPLDLDWEIKRIEADLRAAKERDRLEFKLVVAATIDSMMQAMLDDSPTIVHFSGHGQTEGILLRNEAGQSQLVSGKALASLFKLFRETVNCVVLNACWSEPQARAIREHIPHVIGTRAQIADDNAVAFSTGFYKAIGAGRDVPFAYEMGLARVQVESDDAGELVTLL
jgi:hypothetical protein